MEKSKDQNINIRMTSEALNEYAKLFGPMKRKEMVTELIYYITKLYESNKNPARVLNYDNEKAIYLERVNKNSFVIIGFGRVS
jgi:hypothetical protein